VSTALSCQTVPAQVLVAARGRSNRPILTLLDAQGEVRAALSYTALLDRASLWQALFTDLGLVPSDRIVVALPHGADLYAAYIGALLGGFVPSMFAFPSPKMTEEAYFETLRALVGVATPRVFVTFETLRPKIAAHLTSVPLHVISPESLPPACGARAAAAEPSPSAEAFLQYSSGTTGLKKGVAISHAALLWQVTQYGRAIALSPDDVIVNWLPLYHDMGLICGFFLPLLTGTPVVAMDPFDWVVRPAMVLDAITRHRGTLCWQPNFAYSLLARTLRHTDVRSFVLSSVRALINCSEPVLDDSHRSLLQVLSPCGLKASSLGTCYAMAEQTFAATSSEAGQPAAVDEIDADVFAREGRAAKKAASTARTLRLVSSGRALPATQVTIQTPDGSALPERHAGEIVIASPSLAAAYLGPGAAPLSDGGRYRTGDLGYLADGELYVTGRRKDLIIVSGRNIYPHDVEALAHDVRGVVAGRVVAFGVPDAESGTERLIVQAELPAPDGEDARAIVEAVRARLSQRLGVAAHVEAVSPRTLRKSTSGKLARAANRDVFLQQGPRTALVAPKPAGDVNTGEALAVALESIGDVLGEHAARALSPDDSLIVSGRLGSLDLVGLIIAIERRIGRRLPAASLELGHFETARKIARLIDHVRHSADLDAVLEANETRPLDDREKAALFFQRHARSTDVLFLGSSRTRHVSAQVAALYGFTAFNFWTTSARVEDWYCALRFALDEQTRLRGAALRGVLIGIDAEAFTPASGIEPLLTSAPLLARYLDEQASAAAAPGAAPAWAGTTGLDERFVNVRWQLRLASDEPTWFTTTHAGPRTSRVASSRPIIRGAPPLLTPDDKNPAYALRFEGFDRLAPWRVDYFQRLLALVRQHELALICYVTPVHHTLDAFLRVKTTYTQRLSEIQSLVVTHAPSAVWLDTSTVEGFGGTPGGFHDGAHANQENSETLTHLLMQTFNTLPRPGNQAGDRADARPSARATRAASNVRDAADRSGTRGASPAGARITGATPLSS
jgi:fatty-acyl-CoA synthase